MSERELNRIEIFCLQDQRFGGKQLTFSFERKRIMLEENDI